MRRADELKLLGRQQARAITVRFRAANLEALATEPGPRPPAAQLENRQRRWGLRLLSLPECVQSKEVGVASMIGKWFEKYAGRTEAMVSLEEPEAFDAETI